MKTYCFYVEWIPAELPFWYEQPLEQTEEPEMFKSKFFVNSNFYRQAIEQVVSLPGHINKVLSYRDLEDFSDDELKSQGFSNINLYSTY
jgi:hypothetical protein